jgi:hypothetical protein
MKILRLNIDFVGNQEREEAVEFNLRSGRRDRGQLDRIIQEMTVRWAFMHAGLHLGGGGTWPLASRQKWEWRGGEGERRCTFFAVNILRRPRTQSAAKTY